MSALAVDRSLLLEPRLWTPGQQPLGNFALDNQHKITQLATSILFPWKSLKCLKYGYQWTIGGSGGALVKKVFYGRKCLAREDDDAVGEYISSPASFMTRATGSPVAFFLSVAMWGSDGSIFSTGLSSVDEEPELLLIGTSSSTYKILVNNSYPTEFTGISTYSQFFQHLAIVFDGSKWTVMNNQGLYVEKIAGTQNTARGGTVFIGTGYYSQKACAWDHVIVFNTLVPIDLARSWVYDPYQFLIPA